MRVLHVIPSAAPVDGGPNVAVRAIARRLARRGIDVTVATTNAAGAGSLDVPVDTPVIDDGVVFRYFARSVPGSWKFSWPMTRWLWANAGSYDVVHVHALFSYATIPGCRAAARVPVPYVLRPLGTLSDWSLGHRRWKKRPYYALLERSHLAGASAIHVTSDAEADDVARLGYGNRARVIPLGVDVGARPPRHARAPSGSEPLRLLFLSRLHEKKNVPMLLRALAAAANASRRIELTVAGDGEPGYREQLDELANQLGLREVVSFAGHVDGRAKARAFAEADCFVLPSSHENFGLAVAEAMAAGLPAIVTPDVALARDVHAVGAGVVTEPTENALASALVWASEHRATLLEMGDRAWQHASRELSWETTCMRLAALYEELAAGHRCHEERPA
ncbi:MAG TPA: glycosyltransferase [Gemmatimonadaceae bacterium]|nr:glycosyltransferase [Gemmatimonadaceae bacterium]